VGIARALRRRCEIGLAGEWFEFVAREWANELHELACAQGNDDQITRAAVFGAILTEQEGDLVQAVQILERSVERMPNGVWRNHYELGRALCQLGEYARAETVSCEGAALERLSHSSQYTAEGLCAQQPSCQH
jgi:tetratricopeptide (TPR) repeat protein